MVDIKALMGDSSDCIPGVAGIGQKTAQDLVSRFGTIEEIYENLESLDIKKGVHDKLANDRDMAFLSRELGTIRRDAPVETSYEAYIPAEADAFRVTGMLAQLEMFKMIERLNLKAPEKPAETESAPEICTACYEQEDLKFLYNKLRKDGEAYFIFDSGIFYFKADNGVAEVVPMNAGYVEFCTEFLFNNDIKIHLQRKIALCVFL